MSRDNSLPFGRGEMETVAGALDHLLGREYVFEDVDYSQTGGARQNRSGKMVRVRLVKNEAGINLLPGHLVRFSNTAGEHGRIVDGYTRLTHERGYPVDEFLPAAGVPDQAYFFIVVEGPAMVKTAVAGADFNGDIVIGASLNAGTAGASTGTTAGRVQVQNVTGGSQATDYSFAIQAAQNLVGYALSAATTGNTNTTILADIGKW